MEEVYTNYIDKTLSLFEKQFANIYRKMDVKKRARLLPYISTIFRRWYFSALIEDTILTPANVIESVNLAHEQDADTYPVIRLKSPHKYMGIDRELNYTEESNHPIVSDMRKLVEYCSPSIALSTEDGFWDAQAIELSSRLSLNDPHYASFLLEISLWMGLIIKIPSIYANRTQVAKDAEEHLSLPEQELFNEIVITSIKMSSSSLNQLIALPEPIFTESFVHSLLTKPVETDEIFQCVYDTIGFSMDDLYEPDMGDEMDGLDAAFLSGTFMMGVLLDKYFFTPFSYYLRLIRPMYVLPFDFEQELGYFLETFDSDDEVAAAFFAPCSKYTLTKLGLKHFDVKPESANYINIPEQLPFTLLEARLFNQPELMKRIPIWVNQSAYKYSNEFHGGQLIYHFKIKMEADTSLWMHLEISDEMTLHRLYVETIVRFGLTRNDEYSIFHDDIESPFTEYTSIKRARRTKKTTDAAINTLDLTYKKVMLLVAYNQNFPLTFQPLSVKKHTRSGVRFTIELIETKPKESGTMYPYIRKMSKNLKAMYED